jgi:hypothetical protein
MPLQRDTSRSGCTLGVDEAALLDDVSSATTHVEHDFARNRGLIDANASGASGQSFGRENFGAIGTLEVGGYLVVIGTGACVAVGGV